jgi:hypothetical protein
MCQLAQSNISFFLMFTSIYFSVYTYIANKTLGTDHFNNNVRHLESAHMHVMVSFEKA